LHPNTGSFNKTPMPRKSIRTRRGHFVLLFIAGFLSFQSCRAVIGAGGEAKFLGANSCASSGCHGVAGAHQNQYLVWSSRDFHFQRPFATLTTARSKQISAALQIKDPTTAHQCVSCHAPLSEVPETLRGDSVRITEAVSCETCHAPAENWLRSHTRTDYTHADRVVAGMRDLKNLYVRANTCVACHQTVSPPLLEAGHPELIFELDGQGITEPKHWREKPDWQGAQAWAVGQSVALREMLWQLETSGKQDQKLAARAEALLWLFEKIGLATNGWPKSDLATGQSGRDKSTHARAAADILAQEIAEANWSAAVSQSILRALAKSSGDFKKPATFPEQHARRAERLVLAIDRLCNPQPGSEVDKQLKILFSLAQSIPDFKPGAFGSALEEFAHALDQQR
jgi:hypothetical protein